MKLLPVSVTVTAGEPAVAEEGESETSVAGSGYSVMEMLCELPPPGEGFETERLRVPAEARRVAGTTAVICVELTRVVVNAADPAIATEDELKFVPVRVKVVSEEPA